jgi:hypothetical protein
VNKGETAQDRAFACYNRAQVHNPKTSQKGYMWGYVVRVIERKDRDFWMTMFDAGASEEEEQFIE